MPRVAVTDLSDAEKRRRLHASGLREMCGQYRAIAIAMEVRGVIEHIEVAEEALDRNGGDPTIADYERAVRALKRVSEITGRVRRQREM